MVNTEWTLSRSVTAQLWKVWGTPMIDLMVTELTTQLPTYISPYPDPRAFAVDAMSCEWKGMENGRKFGATHSLDLFPPCLLYTSDAADE